MPHHIHFLVRCPDQHDISWLVQRIKSNSALAIKPLLSEATERGFDEQRGLNGRSFWKKSFRSVVVCSPSVFRQKVNYIHRNPVRAGYVESSDQYRWSSKRFMLQGLWTPEFGLDIEAVLRAWD